jgi:hypothetical protein
LDTVAHGDVVLDVGGWGRPFKRADWVLDLMPYGATTSASAPAAPA